MGLQLAGDCGAPQGSILGPSLFNTFTNGLEAGTECSISKFADDTNLGSAADSLEEQEALQTDPDRLEHWAVINGTKFNMLKCWILHLKQSNTGQKYKLGEEWLETAPQKGAWGCRLAGCSPEASSVCALAAKPFWDASNTASPLDAKM